MARSGDVHEVFYHQDIASNKVVAGLAYIVFFLPLIMRPHSAFARFHANQAIVLWVFVAADIALRMFLIFFPTLGKILFYVIGAFLLCLAIIGMVTAFRGRAKKLPFIGDLKLLK